jgi:hypothetical protein
MRKSRPNYRIVLLVAPIAAALLLGAAGAAPSAALAATDPGTGLVPHQYSPPSSAFPYGANGYGPFSSAYPYGGSGTAAWYGGGYYPGSYGNGFDASPYEGSPGNPYNHYGPHYGYGQPAYVNPSNPPPAPGS